MPAKPKAPKPPAPPKAAIKKLADLQDQSLAIWQAQIRPWMLEMERFDMEQGRPVSADRREEQRDDLNNRLHDSAHRTRQLRDKVQDETLLRPQAPPAEEPGFASRRLAEMVEEGRGDG